MPVPKIITTAQSLDHILKWAHAHELPMPYAAHATRYGTLDMGFDSLADVTEWAMTMDVVIDVTPGETGHHHRASGELQGQSLEVWTIVKFAAVAS